MNVLLFAMLLPAAVKKSIADLIEDDAERRGDGTSLTGTFVRVSVQHILMHLRLKQAFVHYF